LKIALSFPGCHKRAGVERIVYECAQFLAAAGHDVHLLASEWQPDVEAFATCHEISTTRHPWFLTGVSYHHNCRRFLADFPCDVLSTHGVVCPVGGVHWTQSLHASWLDRSRQIRPSFSLSRARQRLNPLHPILLKLEEAHFRRRNYKKLIATTAAVRDDLNRFYDVPLGDVEILPNGFNPLEFSPSRRAARRQAMREQLGLKEDQIALLFVGNELERKGYRTILEAMKQLSRSDIRLLVVGKPPTEMVMKLAADFEIADQVIACGSTQTVADYHAAADLFVLPTQYEAFCLAILESLASGLSVLTSNVAGAADAIQPGVNGDLVQDPTDGEELADVLAKMIDPIVLARCASNAAASVEAYQWPRILSRYEAILRGCAGETEAKGGAASEYASAPAH
jgi:UDP-glucose:(heptosyl)LPS alpha-1,3-glucosyltransferase